MVLGGIDFGTVIPSEYGRVIEDFVTAEDATKAIIFLYYQGDHLVVENQLTQHPSVKKQSAGPVKYEEPLAALDTSEMSTEAANKAADMSASPFETNDTDDQKAAAPAEQPQTNGPDFTPWEASIFYFVHNKPEVGVGDAAPEEEFAKTIQAGVITPQIIDQLLNLMTTVFTPWIKQVTNWPLSVKDEFLNQLERYLSSVTEVSHLQRGHTVLYIPVFEDINPQESSRNKDIIPRLETLVVHWTRYIKELISGIHQNRSQEDKNQLVQLDEGYQPFPLLYNPLSEIEYWRRRNDDLYQVINQLKSPSLINIIQTLKYAYSHYAYQFELLETELYQKTDEASKNLYDLQYIEELCVYLTGATKPHEVYLVVKPILDQIIVISYNSSYYNIPSNLSSLLRRVANAVVNSCATYISLRDVFEKDALLSIRKLKNCKELIIYFKELYQSICNQKIWDDDNSVIASCDAFSYRCIDLFEICYDRLYFYRSKTLLDCKNGLLERLLATPSTGNYYTDYQNYYMIGVLESVGHFVGDPEDKRESKKDEYEDGDYMLPKFSGNYGEIVRKSIREMYDDYRNILSRVMKVNYNHLDVRASKWHEDVAQYRYDVKDLTVFAENIMKNSFSSVQSNVVESCNVLAAFDHLASRPTLRSAVSKKVSETIRAFIEKVNYLKTQFETLKASQSQENRQLPLSAVLAHQCFMPTRGSMAISIRRLIYQLEQDWDNLLNWLDPKAKYIAYDAISRQKFNSQQLNQLYFSEDITKDEFEAIDIYVRTKVIFESNIERTYLEWKQQTEQIDPAESLEREVIAFEPSNKFSDFVNSVDLTTNKLNLTLLQNRLICNVSAEVNSCLQEHFVFTDYFTFKPPVNSQELYFKRSKLHMNEMLVQSCVNEVNYVVDYLQASDVQLFKQRLSKLADKIYPLFVNKGWENVNLILEIGKIRAMAVEDYNKILLYYENKRMIDNSIKELLNINLFYVRKTMGYGAQQKQLFQPVELYEFLDMQVIVREGVVKQIQYIFDNTLNALVACYDIFRADGDEIQKEWIRHVQYIDEKIEQTVLEMYSKAYSDFAMAITGRRLRPDPAEYYNGSGGEPIFHMVIQLEKGGKGPEIVPALDDLTAAITMILKQAVYEVIPRIYRLSKSLIEKETILKYENIRLKEQHAQDMILKAENEGLPLSDYAKAEVFAEVEMWRNISVPYYVVKGEYFEMFSFLDDLFADGTTQQMSKVKSDIHNAIEWIRDYVADCCGYCQNSLNYYTVYKDCWLENPTQYYYQHYKELMDLSTFKGSIYHFIDLIDKLQIADNHYSIYINFMDANQLIKEINSRANQFRKNLQDALLSSMTTDLNNHYQKLQEIIEYLAKPSENVDQLKEQLVYFEQSKQYLAQLESLDNNILNKIITLKEFDVECQYQEEQFEKIKKYLGYLAQQSIQTAAIYLQKEKNKYREIIQVDINQLQKDIKSLRELIEENGPFSNNIESKDANQMVYGDITAAFRYLRDYREDMQRLQTRMEYIEYNQRGFTDNYISDKELKQIDILLTLLERIWEFAKYWYTFVVEKGVKQLQALNQQELIYFAYSREMELRKLVLGYQGYYDPKNYQIIKYLQMQLDYFRPIPNLIVDLYNPSMRGRHWAAITERTKIHIEVVNPETEMVEYFNLDPTNKYFTLYFIVDKYMSQFADEINYISGGATYEEYIEKSVYGIEDKWFALEYVAYPYYSKGVGGVNVSQIQHYILKETEDVFYALEESTLQISALKGSKFAKAHEFKLDCWENLLGQIYEATELILQAQSAWMYLESIFAASDDIRKQLPNESIQFDEANESWRRNLTNIYRSKKVLFSLDVTEVVSPKLRLTKTSNLVKSMLNIIQILDQVYKYLESYLERKRSQFPRFYFLSNDELLEILAQSRNPLAVYPHIKKCFDGMKYLDMVEKKGVIVANGIFGYCSECVPFLSSVNCNQTVEVWLTAVESMMKQTLQDMVYRCYTDFMADKLQLPLLLGKWPGYLCVVAQYLRWTDYVQIALSAGKEAYLENEDEQPNPEYLEYLRMENLNIVRKALRGARKRSVMFLQRLTEIFTTYPDIHKQLKDKISLNSYYQKNFDPKLVSNKTRAQITLEIHNRDVIDQLYHAKVQEANCFEWFSQLKFFAEQEQIEGSAYKRSRIVIKQTEAALDYQFEYCNNSGRLVITPLTDRCYITITSSILIYKGTLPQGPAGTGKTETVKDLSKALAVYCVVFNCSDGLDYKSLGRMFSGLCQCGAWSCFDEFNRLLPDVLSVVAQYINVILQAISSQLTRFVFEGREIPLNSFCNICITMNPGYAGRSELPENLYQLFRPISMVVPDMRLIAEVMIYSEGFKEAKVLGYKLTSLFSLCNLYLSKQTHYDWTLRSLKAILVAAGSLKRQDPTYQEDQILMRAMQFSTEPKLIKADLPLFKGLVSDLFPGLEFSELHYGLLEAAIDLEFCIRNLYYNSKQKEKVLYLYEAKLARHGVMLIGRSGGGKTLSYEILCAAMIRCYQAMVESCDDKKRFKNPYCALLNSVCIEKKEFTNLPYLLKSVYNDQSGNDKILAEKNHFIKCIYYIREIMRELADPTFKTYLTEPVYDAAVATVHDKQFMVTIKFMNPKSLTVNQMYGNLDVNTNEWIDGIVSNILRSSSKDSYMGLPFHGYDYKRFNEIVDALSQDNCKYEALKEITRYNNFWIMYDGPVDTLWIESQNSVLDDSKVLTLVNGERISFPNQISMLFEANDLDVASPATVSRCGQCYFDLNDINFDWQYWQWVEHRYKQAKVVQNISYEVQHQISDVLETFGIKVLKKLFDYKDYGLMPYVIFYADYAIVRMFITLFETLATDFNGLKAGGEDNQIPRMIEMIVIYCAVWAFGGSLTTEGRKNLDIAIRELESSMPSSDTVFDYKIDLVKKQWVHWGDMVGRNWRPAPGVPLFSVLVPTVDTIRSEYMLKTMILAQNLYYLRYQNYKSLAGANFYTTNIGTMFFGVSGAGKTGIIKNYLLPALENADIGNCPFSSYYNVTLKSASSTDIEAFYVDGKLGQYNSVQLGLSAYTTADRLRIVVESRLQATATSLAPKGKRLLAFLDDFNMPQYDEFGSYPCLEIIKYYIERGSWYRQRKERYYLSNVQDVDILASMATPGGGRNYISGRILSKFNIIAIDTPTDAVLRSIFTTLLNIHFYNFEDYVKYLIEPSVAAGIDIYNQISQTLLPTPVKPFYVFNLRDLSKFFSGIMRATYQVKTVEHIAKLWTHECMRVYYDRMIPADRPWFNQILEQKMGQTFDLPIGKVFVNKQAPIFVDFLNQELVNVKMSEEDQQGVDKIVGIYEEVNDHTALRATVEQKLHDYNQSGAAVMDLVMFYDALEHVCKICRILSQPQGHALLIGTGGTGRYSMARMAAYLENYTIFVIEVGKNYKNQNFRDDIKKLFIQAGGAEQKPSTLLLTDNQISDESFLEDINSLLSSGEIPGLFNNEDLQYIADNLSPICKYMRISETIDSCYQLLIRRAKENLHIILCFSPSHEKFRNRLRMYPGLLSSCTIDLFGEWPLSALNEVGNYFINKFEDLKEYTEQDLAAQKARPYDPNLPKVEPVPLPTRLANVFMRIHDYASQASTTMAYYSGRKLFVTPANYLNFVRLYIQVFVYYRDKIQNKINKYSGGVKYLIYAQDDVTVMKEQLEIKKTEVMAKKELSDKLLIQVNTQQQYANEKSKKCEEDRIKLQEVEAELLEKTKEAEYKLSLALPQYEQAQEALNGLKDSAIQEVQNYKKYTKGVLLTLQAVMVLLNKPYNFDAIKTELSKPGFLQSLKQYDYKGITKSQQEYLKKFYTHEDFVPRTIEAASLPCKCICVWVIALYEFTNIWRVVKPLYENAERMKMELQRAQETLAQKERELEEQRRLIAELEVKYNNELKTLQLLYKEEEYLSNKLERANNLVGSLQGERTRWLASIEKLKVEISKIPGDCVIATAFLCYSGGLSGKFRAEVMKNWIGVIYDEQIATQVTEQFNVASYLVDPAVQYSWTVQGLPSDQFSAENGVLITQSNKQPYVIDPQKQAIRWLKRMLEYNEKTRENFKILNVKEPNYLYQIELAVKYGSTVILEDVTENIDPSLDPIITKQVIKKGGALVIKMKDKTIEYNENFRIILCTRINNPNLSPELFAKTTVVNFSLVHEGLSDQLLACVVLKENKALEEKKSFFVTSTAAKKEYIIKLEDEILEQLANSTTNLLDNEPLQKALEQSKQTSDEVTKELETFAVMERKIDTLRGGYKPIAERASMLFFIMQDLSNVDFMYQFSLDSYIKLFNNSIDNSQPHEDISHRIKIINDYHTYAVYKYCCRGLFTRHKVLLSLHMCVKILESYNKINIDEYMFLLRGGYIFDKSQQPANPASEWISATMWDNLCCLDKMPVFRGIVPQFESRVNEWKNNYFIANEPETAQLVGELDSTLDELQKMLVLRCLRPDRLIHGINNFVKNNLNTGPYNFTAPPPFDLKQALLDSAPTIPIIFILSQGTDPTAILAQFAKDCKMQDRLLSVALGQGQYDIATKAFKDGVKNGKWVMLANVHLSTDWLIQLEKMVEDLSVSQTPPHKDFRLWLSTFATPKFPIGLLQNSIKITTEAPSGIRANLLYAYNHVNDNLLSTFQKADEDAAQQQCDPSNPQSLTFEQKDNAFRKLVFSTSFFYALLVERRKFGTLGFNIKYPFSQSDFETSLDLLKSYLTKYNTMPWQAIRYVIAYIVFGGRVIDDLDRRILICYINDLFNDELINEQQYMLSNDSEAYYVPPKGSLYEYKEYIKTLPSGSDIADVFGYHNNADIFSRNLETQDLLYTILGISYFNESTGDKADENKEEKKGDAADGDGYQKEKGGQYLSARDERIIKMAQEISLSLPAELTNLPTKIIPEDPNAPMLSVLLYEAERYMRLRESISKDMYEVQRGIKGLIGMSQHLDNIANCLYYNRVPDSWSISYKSTKSLAPWSRDFKRRVEQIYAWANNGHPKCIWLGGLAVPTCYLTSLLQQASRKTSVAIDNLEWGFEITMWTDPVREVNDSQVPKIGEGVLVYDVFLEGAGWHMDNRCLKDSTPMELYVPMPIIKFIPLKQYKKSNKYKAAFYECPVYFYPIRTGTREQPSFMLNAWLNVGQNSPEFYIKRGTALLLNLGD